MDDRWMEKIEQMLQNQIDELKGGQDRIERKLEAHDVDLKYLRDVTTTHQADLNNGIKSQMQEVVRKVGTIERRVLEHEASTPNEDARRREIVEVHGTINKGLAETKHRTIEIGVAIMTGVAVLANLRPIIDGIRSILGG